MGRQCAACYGNQFLRGKTAGNSERWNDEEESCNEHVDTQRQVVPRSIRVDSSEGTAVVAGTARVRIQDFRKAVGPIVVRISGGWTRRIPVTALGERRNRTDRGEGKN